MIENEKYKTNSQTVEGLIGDIINKNIAIPEIQRPFVWRSSQVRDLIDSLYKGYPTGYIIEWFSPDAKLKDGSNSVGKKILIDGQQRVTALMTAIAGEYVVNSKYEKVRIKIAFNPFLALSKEKDVKIFVPKVLDRRKYFMSKPMLGNPQNTIEVIQKYEFKFQKKTHFSSHLFRNWSFSFFDSKEQIFEYMNKFFIFS